MNVPPVGLEEGEEWRPGEPLDPQNQKVGALDPSGELQGDQMAICNAPAFRLFAESGVVVPGAAKSRPASPDTARWRAFGVPTPVKDGVGCLATIGADGGTFDGIFGGGSEDPELLLRTPTRSKLRKQRPIEPITFVQLSEPAFAATDTFVVLARSRNGHGEEQTGLWFRSPGVVLQILLLNGPAPGLLGARVTHVESYVMTGSRDVFVVGQMRREGFDGMVRTLWSWNEKRGWRLLLCEGATLPTAQGPVIESLTALRASVDSPNEQRYDQERGIVPVSVRWKGGRTAILTVTGEGGVAVQWQSDISRNKHAVANTLPISDILSSDCGIVARVVTPGNGSLPTERIILARHERTEVVIESGRIAPGTVGRTFKSFSEPVANASTEHSAIAFLATLQQVHGTNSRTTERGVWWRSAETGSALRLVARSGDPAPGCAGLQFVDFRSIAMLPEGGPIFSASMSRSGGVRDDLEIGLWAVNRAGQIVLLLRQGESIFHPDDADSTRVVQGFDVFRVSKISIADPTSLRSQRSCCAVRVTFAEGGSGVVTASLDGIETNGAPRPTLLVESGTSPAAGERSPSPVCLADGFLS